MIVRVFYRVLGCGEEFSIVWCGGRDLNPGSPAWGPKILSILGMGSFMASNSDILVKEKQRIDTYNY